MKEERKNGTLIFDFSDLNDLNDFGDGWWMKWCCHYGH